MPKAKKDFIFASVDQVAFPLIPSSFATIISMIMRNMIEMRHKMLQINVRL